jgi:hypothetical protein
MSVNPLMLPHFFKGWCWATRPAFQSKPVKSSGAHL